MSNQSPRLLLPFIQSAQAQKHVTHNEALSQLDTLVQLTLETVEALSPPTDPAPGAVYALAAGATDAWAGQSAGTLAWWDGTAWRFAEPEEGWLGWDRGAGRLVTFGAGAWGPADPQSLETLGINATADSVNRLAVGSEATLFTHDGAGHQIKVNKAAAGDDAGHVFQTGYTTHALFGLLADDDFTLKVSPDGSAFHDAMKVDRSSGEVTLAQGARLGTGGDLLDIYDQGTWTPTFGASTTDPTGSAYTSSGKYLRIGALIFATFELIFTDRGTGGAGNVRIRDLPFASSGNFYASDLRHSGVTFPGSGTPMMRSSGTTLTLFSSNGADMLWQDLPSGSGFSLLGSLVYIGV